MIEKQQDEPTPGSREWVAGVMEKVFEECRALRGAGQKEYAHNSNAFANFERVAERLGISREAVLMVYAEKHLDGIHSCIQGHRSQRESVTGRIDDVIVYLVLLRGMVEQDALRPSVGKDVFIHSSPSDTVGRKVEIRPLEEFAKVDVALKAANAFASPSLDGVLVRKPKNATVQDEARREAEEATKGLSARYCAIHPDQVYGTSMTDGTLTCAVCQFEQRRRECDGLGREVVDRCPIHPEFMDGCRLCVESRVRRAGTPKRSG